MKASDGVGCVEPGNETWKGGALLMPGDTHRSELLATQWA